jgi:hypothetical protein
VEPAHEEDAQREAVHDDDNGCVLTEEAGIDVTHQMVFEHREAVVHVRARFSVREAVEEAAKAQAFRFLAFLAGRVLEVAKVLLWSDGERVGLTSALGRSPARPPPHPSPPRTSRSCTSSWLLTTTPGGNAAAIAAAVCADRLYGDM